MYASKDGQPLSDAEKKAALLPLVHDRMTEQVFESLDACQDMFHHYAPRELSSVDILAGGREALAKANIDSGFALSDDEIDYLVENYKKSWAAIPPTLN